MIIEEGTQRVAVSTDVASAYFTGTKVLRAAHPAEANGVILSSTRAVVELRRAHGGMMARALLGGELSPASSREATFEVLVADEPLGLGNSATCTSRLGKPLVPGLPEEFAEAVLTGLSAQPEQLALPAGTLHVDRAGHDEVNSSPIAFQLAAGLLRTVLAVKSSQGDLEVEIRNLMRAW